MRNRDDNLLWEAMQYQLHELNRQSADQFEQSLADDDRILALADAVALDLAMSEALNDVERPRLQSASTVREKSQQPVVAATETRESASRFAVVATVMSVCVAAVLLVSFRSDPQPERADVTSSPSEFPYELIWNDQIAEENLALSLNDDSELPGLDDLIETDLIAGVPDVPTWMLAAVTVEESALTSPENETEAN